MDIGPDRRGKRDRTADALVVPFQQFFVTASVPCPYVPGRAERKLIVELAGRGAPEFYDELSRAGFRRSHRFSYRIASPGMLPEAEPLPHLICYTATRSV
jgi:hypothetical protein